MRVITFVFFLFLLSFWNAEASELQIPDLQLKNLEGQSERLSDYRGKILILNFWATWCVPCQREMPLFTQLQSEYQEKGVQFIAASTDTPETQGEIPKFVREYGLNFPVWLGATAKQQLSFKLGTGLPATVIINANGQACFRIIGESTRKILVERIEYLLSGGTSSASPAELVLPPGITPEHFKEHHESGIEEEHKEETVERGSMVPS